MNKLHAIIVSVILIIICISTSAIAEINLSSMTETELRNLIIAAQNELNNRTNSSDNSTIYQNKNIKWYITNAGMQYSWSSYYTINTVIENNSKNDVTITIDSLSINGWDVTSFVYASVSAGKKTKEDISFKLDDANISHGSEITSLEITLRIYNSNNYNTIDETTVKIIPNFQ